MVGEVEGEQQDAAQAESRAHARCGFAALVGRPNVGKSTLLNALLGRKLSIVTPKPQTTRHRVHGVLTRPGMQIVFVDLPGIHSTERRALNRALNRTAASSLADADVNLFLIEALRFDDEDQKVLQRLVAAGRPIILLINKVDRVHPRERLLGFIDEMRQRAGYAEIVPLSALKRENLERLPELIATFLPEGPLLYPPGQVTDVDDRFLAAEVVREKLMLLLREEIPYGLMVEIERFAPDEEDPARLLVNAIVWVEREGQKAIVIGKGGEMLKRVGSSARIDLKRMFARPVHLELWVKVKEDWPDNVPALKRLGYDV